jgi:hypothetical protein
LAAQTAEALRELADAADRGEIIGIAYCAFDPHKEIIGRVAGYAKANKRDAHFGAHRLAYMLLYGAD